MFPEGINNVTTLGGKYFVTPGHKPAGHRGIMEGGGGLKMSKIALGY